MDGFSILIILLILLALAGVVIYFIYDYIDYKNKVTTNLNAATDSITEESKERLGNLAYVVNQVNTVNDDIYGTLTSNIVYTNSNVNVQTSRNNNLIAGLSSIMNYTTMGGTTNATNISLFDLPGSPGNVNVNLLKHVTATMGLTANNLTPAAPAEFCSSTGCVRFPDSSGNTFLGSLTPTGQVVLDGSVRVNSNMSFGGVGSPTLGVSPNSQNSLLLNNNRYLGIGTNNPQYTLDVLGTTNDNLMRLNSSATPAGGSPALLVNANGDLIVSQSIQIKPNTAGSTAISLYSSGSSVPTGAAGIIINPTSSGKGLEIKAEDGVTIKGDLRVTGSTTFGSNVNISSPNNLTVSSINGKPAP